jgi:hypothetical protein
MVQATAGESRGPIRAFDLLFEGRVYSGENQTNDLDARYLYLEPGHVRMVMKSGRERMRGPKGDYLIDKSGVYPLRGREYAEDQRELDETVAVARLFVGLSDPGRLRLASLEVLPAPPPRLPEAVAKKAAELDWIVLLSPDFRRHQDGARATLDRVELGLERESHVPVLAVVTHPTDPHSAVLARLKDYQPLDGYRVPYDVTTWRIAPDQAATGPAAGISSQRLAFAAKPAIRLWLKEGRLRPRLEPADFEPPPSK